MRNVEMVITSNLVASLVVRIHPQYQNMLFPLEKGIIKPREKRFTPQHGGSSQPHIFIRYGCEKLDSHVAHRIFVIQRTTDLKEGDRLYVLFP